MSRKSFNSVGQFLKLLKSSCGSKSELQRAHIATTVNLIAVADHYGLNAEPKFREVWTAKNLDNIRRTRQSALAILQKEVAISPPLTVRIRA